MEVKKVYCDFCKAENPEFRNKIIPVLTDCSWEDGYSCNPRIDYKTFDLCSKCMLKVTNIKCGYRGTDSKFIHDEDR